MKPPTTPPQQPAEAPAEHGDGTQAVAPGVPAPIPVPDDAPVKLSVALCGPKPGQTARGLVLDRLYTHGWAGNEDAASRIADVLVTNAATHAAPLDCGDTPLRLVILPDSQVLIEVDDGTPDFPDFDKALAQAPIGRGLWWVTHYRGRLTYYPLRDEQGETVGKTVQVLLTATWGETA